MVYIRDQAIEDIDTIFFGLYNWKKINLDFHFCKEYISNIFDECYLIEHLSFHFRTDYNVHKIYGEFVHRYKKTPRTTWYIIYNIDTMQNILIGRIMSNYTTVD